MKTKKHNTTKAFFIIAMIIMLSFTVTGCATSEYGYATSEPCNENRVLTGVSNVETTDSSVEIGRHWVRPQELTYKPLDIIDYETIITITDLKTQDAVIFGYPKLSEEAGPFVTRAISQAIIETGADGFLLSAFTIEQLEHCNGNTAKVKIHGRPLQMVHLGEVDLERADKERFITTMKVVEDKEKGIIETTTTSTPIIEYSNVK